MGGPVEDRQKFSKKLDFWQVRSGIKVILRWFERLGKNWVYLGSASSQTAWCLGLHCYFSPIFSFCIFWFVFLMIISYFVNWATVIPCCCHDTLLKGNCKTCMHSNLCSGWHAWERSIYLVYREEYELLEAVQARLAVHHLTAPVLGNDHSEFRSRENPVRTANCI